MHEQSDQGAEVQMKRLSRRSFIWAGVAVLSTYEIFHWINNQGFDNGLPSVLRRGLEFNEKVVSTLYSPNHLSPTFKDSDVTVARVNGDIGMGDHLDAAEWRLNVLGSALANPAILSLEQVKALPKEVYVSEFKCIEGWSQFVKWGGARFTDFHSRYPAPAGTRYVLLETPDKGYYVSIDLPSMLHPQTLLCYEMNGIPLTAEHGAPLRLVIPHKYGVKNIKRIGSITYCAERPKDYWGELGYDWYAGL